MTIYKEIKPPPNLRHYIKCLWYFDRLTGSEKSTNRVIPDNCIDIIFDYSETDNVKCFAIGMMTRSILSDRTRVLGIRFYAGTPISIFKVPLNELTDKYVDLKLLLNNSHYELVKNILDIPFDVHLSNTPDQIIRPLITESRGLNPIVTQAVRKIVSMKGSERITRLSKDLDISRQYLSRLFETHVGITPKQFARIERIQSLIKSISTNSEMNIDWASLACSQGYYDQSHLISDFRTVAGITPGHYFSETFT